MCFFRKQIILSQLTPEQISSRILESESFIGDIKNEEFEIMENMAFSNQFLIPELKGEIKTDEKHTNLNISFKLKKCDKIAISVFLSVILIIAICFGIFSSDVLLALTVIGFDIALAFLFVMYYRKNCRRAYQKLYKLLNTNDNFIITRKLTLFFAKFLTVLLAITFLVNMGSKIRWDKIPIIDIFVLEIELWPSAFDASYLDEPIKWNELDTEPPDWEENGLGRWFSFNTYTKNLLKEYMAKNNYGIIPGEWDEFKFRSNFDECLEIFEFTELSEEERIPYEKSVVPKILLVVFSLLTVVCWILYFNLKRRCSQ